MPEDVYFGYRISPTGVSCWRGQWNIPVAKINSDDPEYPYRQVRRLASSELELTLDELKAKYPYIESEEG